MNIAQIEEFFSFIQNSNDPVVFFSKTSILFILLFLLVRHLVIGNLFRLSSRIDRDTHKMIRKEYVRFSWIGWILFICGVAVFDLLAYKGQMMIDVLSFDMWVLVICMLFVVGIFYHLYFFTRAVLLVYKKRIEIEKN